MKCIEADIIGYMEGKVTKEAKNHIEGCKICSREVEKLEMFSLVVSAHYAKGKSLEEELDKKLQSIDISKMKKLPEDIASGVSALRGKSLTDKLKKVVGRGGKSAKALFDNIMTPQMRAMPASPRDLARGKKRKKPVASRGKMKKT